MTSEDNSQVYEEAMNQIALYAIGFVKISTNNNQESGVCCGSGTLVNLNNKYGILTAAHVVDELQKAYKIGVLTFPSDPAKPYRILLDMEKVRITRIGDEPYSENGPDIAFLELPFDNVSSLKATNGFFSASCIVGDDGEGTYSYIITGTIDEWSKHLSNNKMKFSATFEPGTSTYLSQNAGCDLYEFDIEQSPHFQLPNSFQGMSGGGVWKIFFDRSKGSGSQITKRCFCGVVFFETALTNTPRKIRYNGNQAIKALASQI